MTDETTLAAYSDARPSAEKPRVRIHDTANSVSPTQPSLHIAETGTETDSTAASLSQINKARGSASKIIMTLRLQLYDTYTAFACHLRYGDRQSGGSMTVVVADSG